jgi:hypothetical protein
MLNLSMPSAGGRSVFKRSPIAAKKTCWIKVKTTTWREANRDRAISAILNAGKDLGRATFPRLPAKSR